MKGSNSLVSPFKCQTSHSTSRQSKISSIVDDQRLDRQTLTRTLSGNFLLEDARPRMRFTIQRPRARGASTSICLPEKGAGSPWVTVPRHYGNTPISTANIKELCQEDLPADDDGASGSLTLEEAIPSLSSSDDDTAASLTTLLPTPCGPTTSLLPSRCSQVSQPPEKLKELHQKVRNEELYETLLKDYGICRKEHPVTRRLSTSHALDLAQASQPSACLRPRRKSTSAYQASYSSGSQPIPPHSVIRTSQILGTITLPSPTTPRELCLAAISELEETQATLTEAWSRCCKTRQPIPQIQDLWNALYNFTFIIHLFTALTVDPCEDDGELSTSATRSHDWLHADVRAQCMAWRTPKQEMIHKNMGIACNVNRPGRVEDHSNSDDDHHHHHHNKDHREMYPLSPRQQKDLARVCFEASHMLRPLTFALKALLPQQRELAWAKRTERWRLFLSLKKMVQQKIDDCVRITRCPLTSWLRNARNQACEALGLDTSKVPGGEEEEEDGREVMACGALQEYTEDLEVDDDEEENSGVILEPGMLRRIRIRIISFKAQYYLFCLLSPRCSPDKLEELAAKVTGLLLQLQVTNISDASQLAKLRNLRRNIMRRVEKAERKHKRRLGLVDSVICKMTHRPLHERITRNIKAGWAKTNDVYEIFPRLSQPPMSTASSLEESTAAEEISVEEVEMDVERMSQLHRC